jgi:hypothetical protein
MTAILSLRAFEKVKLYKAWYLVEMTVARQPDLLERGSCCLQGRKRNLGYSFVLFVGIASILSSHGGQKAPRETGNAVRTYVGVSGYGFCGV